MFCWELNAKGVTALDDAAAATADAGERITVNGFSGFHVHSDEDDDVEEEGVDEGVDDDGEGAPDC